MKIRITRPWFVQPTQVWACNLVWEDRPGPTNGPLMILCTAYGETRRQAMERAVVFREAIKAKGGQ